MYVERNIVGAFAEQLRNGNKTMNCVFLLSYMSLSTT